MEREAAARLVRQWINGAGGAKPSGRRCDDDDVKEEDRYRREEDGLRGDPCQISCVGAVVNGTPGQCRVKSFIYFISGVTWLRACVACVSAWHVLLVKHCIVEFRTVSL
jgi:hypothetical protein